MKTMLITLLVGILSIQSTAFAASTSLNTNLKDEAYINDIPFNTRSVAASYLTKEAFFMSGQGIGDEAYVDDIPFDTHKIASEYLAKQSAQLPALSDEAYVDDLEFDTDRVVKKINSTDSEKYYSLVLTPSGKLESALANLEEEVSKLMDEFARAFRIRINNNEIEELVIDFKDGDNISFSAVVSEEDLPTVKFIVVN